MRLCSEKRRGVSQLVLPRGPRAGLFSFWLHGDDKPLLEKVGGMGGTGEGLPLTSVLSSSLQKPSPGTERLNGHAWGC